MAGETEAAVYARLTGHAGVSALAATRVYPKRLPQNPTLPALTYQKVSARHVSSMEGSSNLQGALVQVDAYGRTYAEAKALVRQVQLALEGFRGTAGGVNVQGVLFVTDQDMTDDQDANLVGEQHRVSMDFRVWHQEPTS